MLRAAHEAAIYPSPTDRPPPAGTHLGMERDGRDKLDMLEAAQALLSRNVPQSNRLVHRRRQDKVVLQRHDRTLGDAPRGTVGRLSIVNVSIAAYEIAT